VRFAIADGAVLDASAVVAFLTRTRSDVGERIAEQMLAVKPELWAPHLIDAEVGHVLRRLALRGAMPPDAGRSALHDLNDLRMERVPHVALVGRAWDLRDSVSFYDGLYVALAEELDLPLLTADARLARAHGHRARVELIVDRD
jgi:predicted nucleic acid-binding protein